MSEQVKERPILFRAEMVRAIIAGTKTQTRRIVKPQPELQESYSHQYPPDGPRTSYGYSGWYPSALAKNARHYGSDEHFRKGMPVDFAPRGKPGDRLWVRETWATVHGIPHASVPHVEDFVRYRADDGDGEHVVTLIKGWKPSIHMPREYSRITLEITDVRVQRLADISDEDATAEGVEADDIGHYANYLDRADDAAIGNWLGPKASFASLWQSIHGIGAWKANPWVFAYSFRRIA